MADDETPDLQALQRLAEEVAEKIGYKHPPKSGQFKPGQSGNPKGRKPQQDESMADTISRCLKDRILITLDGKPKKIKAQEVLVKTALSSAMKGDLKALNLIIRALQAEERRRDAARKNQMRGF